MFVIPTNIQFLQGFRSRTQNGPKLTAVGRLIHAHSLPRHTALALQINDPGLCAMLICSFCLCFPPFRIIDNLKGETEKRHWIIFDGDVGHAAAGSPLRAGIPAPAFESMRGFDNPTVCFKTGQRSEFLGSDAVEGR